MCVCEHWGRGWLCVCVSVCVCVCMCVNIGGGAVGVCVCMCLYVCEHWGMGCVCEPWGGGHVCVGPIPSYGILPVFRGQVTIPISPHGLDKEGVLLRYKTLCTKRVVTVEL